ncbi:hypothetical protein F383_23834 [Gossypium arboreum]|uniref:Uncharacterized protein n=1 Tax=Gossypium arboreum TaxID=29729 RepID=A0A0B0M984_GOSAR|nr:hypothetical protein F383_37764 [Gossypium arboreum]KHG17887.1 hypothetical protein F383_23834 [Gossypium arboreum]
MTIALINSYLNCQSPSGLNP